MQSVCGHLLKVTGSPVAHQAKEQYLQASLWGSFGAMPGRQDIASSMPRGQLTHSPRRQSPQCVCQAHLMQENLQAARAPPPSPAQFQEASEAATASLGDSQAECFEICTVVQQIGQPPARASPAQENGAFISSLLIAELKR